MKQIINWLNTTKQGRTIKRFVKTFFWAFIGGYAASKTGVFQADWAFLVESALLTALGFGTDKGIREYKR